MTELNKVRFVDCEATKGTAICNLGTIVVNNLTFDDLSDYDKCFFDCDKYRDSEYR